MRLWLPARSVAVVNRSTDQVRLRPTATTYWRRRAVAVVTVLLAALLVTWTVSAALGGGGHIVTRPTGLTIPAIDIDARIVPVQAIDRVLEVPPEPWVVGWWADGATPGSGSGTVVLDVHLDTAEHGTGPFARVHDLDGGEPVYVEDDAGARHAYVVADVLTFAKEALPYAELFRQDGPERVVLVTCGGQFDPDEGWDSNVVVVLTPA